MSISLEIVVLKEQENLKEVRFKKAGSVKQKLREAVRSQRLPKTGREAQADLWRKYE